MLVELEREESFIASLQLTTDHLMQIPKKHAETILGNHPGDTQKRTFNVDGKYLIICDENGTWWLGFIMLDTLLSLRDGVYVRQDHSMPLRGFGQRLPGSPYCIDGRQITVYPSWMDSKSNVHDWQLWKQLEERASETFVGAHHEEFFSKILSPKTLSKNDDRRRRLAELRATVGKHSSVRA